MTGRRFSDLSIPVADAAATLAGAAFRDSAPRAPFENPVAAAPQPSFAAMRPPRSEQLISVVLPVYNEVAVLDRLHAAVTAALEHCGRKYEVIYVNDGSRDGSAERLDLLAARDPHVRVLHFSRNFGHQAAVQAGLSDAQGHAVIIMDSDLQDDPAAFEKFLECWEQGCDVVYAVRYGRKENPVKRFLFHAFYRVLNGVATTAMPRDAGNFGLLDRRAAREIAGMLDRDRYFPGLRSWVGFRQAGVPVERCRRHDDKPRVSLRGLFRLAKTAIFSFSGAPLTMFYGIAVLSLAACAGLSGFAMYHKVVTGLAVPGWTSTTIVVSLFGALNALGIGVLGEYAIRIYDQVRARPHFIVARVSSSAGVASNSGESARDSAPPPIEDALREQAEELLEWLSHNWTSGVGSTAPGGALTGEPSSGLRQESESAAGVSS